MISEKIWFYLDGEERKGPFDLATIRQLLEAGVITPETWVAREGDPGWTPAAEASDSSFSSPPRPAIHQQPSEEVRSPRSTPSDSSILYWAAIPLFVFFISGIVFSQKIFSIRYPDGTAQSRELSDQTLGAIHQLTPESFPDTQQEIVSAIAMFAVCLIPGLVLCGFNKTLSKLRSKGERISISRQIIQVVGWGLIIIGCLIISFYATTTRSYFLLSVLYHYEIDDQLFGWYTVTLAIPLLLSMYSLRLSRTQRKLAECSGTPPGMMSLIASGWSKITVILILTVAIAPVFVWFQLGKRGNPDALFIEQMIQAIAQAERETEILTRIGEMKKQDTSALVTRPVILNIEIGGKLDEILKNGCPEILMKDGTPLDTWNRLPFRVALDSNGDHAVDLGGRRLEARAVVWSVGFNGKDELGSGDDVVSILK